MSKIETYWVLMVAGSLKERYASKEDATKAAKKFLISNPSMPRAAIQEFDEKGLGHKGRMIFRLHDDYFQYVDTEWVQ